MQEWRKKNFHPRLQLDCAFAQTNAMEAKSSHSFVHSFIKRITVAAAHPYPSGWLANPEHVTGDALCVAIAKLERKRGILSSKVHGLGVVGLA